MNKAALIIAGVSIAAMGALYGLRGNGSDADAYRSTAGNTYGKSASIKSKAGQLDDSPALKNREGLAVATLAGGCFWCVETNYDKVPGVVDVISGYTGGHEEMPTYEEVAHGETHHTEGVQIFYDPQQITFEGILQVLWRTADPTDGDGQYYDRGKQYRPGIYYHDEEQKRIALASRKALNESGRYKKPVVLEIKPFTAFYKAEDYHQNYAKKHPLHYGFYRYGSGRDRYQRRIWGDDLEIDFTKYRPQKAMDGKAPETDKKTRPMAAMPEEKQSKRDDMIMPVSNEATVKETKMSYKKPSNKELKKRLTPLQYDVTQNEGTERPFDNSYWDNKRQGIYVDVVSGEPLFSSIDKYKSGTGWPSFTQPLDKGNIVEKKDRRLFVTRTEIRSKHGDSHLGHVFEDGPAPTGLRYCMNSASLRFIPHDKLEEEGYGQYVSLFKNSAK